MYFGSCLLIITVELTWVNAANNSLYYTTYRVVAGINDVIGSLTVERVTLLQQPGEYGFRAFLAV
jgi:hypothetical protein